MAKFVWIAFAVILATVAGALWWNISDPVWTAGFATAAIGALLPVLLKRKTPEEERAWNEFMRTNPSKEEIRRWKAARRKK